MTDQLDWIEQAAKVGLNLKEQIRLGHELLRDLKTLRHELEEQRLAIRQLIEQGIPTAVQSGFKVTYGQMMSDYQDEIAEIADNAVKKLVKHTRESQQEMIATMKDSVAETIETIDARYKERNQ